MTSMPGSRRGRSRSVPGSVSASFRHGIWMISFDTMARPYAPTSFSMTPSHVIAAARARPAAPCDAASLLSAA